MEIAVSITLKNNRKEELFITLPAGLVLEHSQTEYGVQNVALEREYIFKLPGYSQQKVVVYGRCLNSNRALPSSTPGRLTLFRYAGSSMVQEDIWKNVSTPKK